MLCRIFRYLLRLCKSTDTYPSVRPANWCFHAGRGDEGLLSRASCEQVRTLSGGAGAGGRGRSDPMDYECLCIQSDLSSE